MSWRGAGHGDVHAGTEQLHACGDDLFAGLQTARQQHEARDERVDVDGARRTTPTESMT